MCSSDLDWTGQLDDLVRDGKADAAGLDPFTGSADSDGDPSMAPARVMAAPSSERRRLICDAVVPRFEPRLHWLSVYELQGELDPSVLQTTASSHPLQCILNPSLRRLDHFALRDAENETCWFYPTDDGTYLSWENQRRVQSWPGFLPERPLHDGPMDYQRSAVHVLWSLMADDLALTCVGLTYQGRRIEFPMHSSDPEPFATWTSFCVDSSAESSYRETASITVFSGDAGE